MTTKYEQSMKLGIDGRKNELTLRFARVTPHYAQTLLDSMLKNRPVKAVHLDRLKRDMFAGNYFAGALDPIRVSDTGRLLDGQHRLRATIETGITNTLLLDSGYDEKDFWQFDQNAARSNRDQLKTAGKANADLLSSFVTTIWRLGLMTQNWSAKKPSNSEAQEFVQMFDNDEWVQEDIAYAQRQYSDSSVRHKKNPIMVSRFLLSKFHDRAKVIDFFDSFLYGKNNAWLDKSNPARKLKDKLQKAKANAEEYKRLYHGAGGDNWHMLYIVEAFTKFKDNKPLRSWQVDKVAHDVINDTDYWKTLCSMAYEVSIQALDKITTPDRR